MEQSIQDMIADLEAAKSASSDVPDVEPMSHTHVVHSGGRGRPRMLIDPEVLAISYQLRGPTELGEIFGVSARTVRRRALEQELVQPGEPVYITYVDENGHAHRVYQSSTSSQSTLTDEELDKIVLHILNLFPTFGRRMIDGHLLHLGQHVPRSRVQSSYARINGPPVAAFGVRRISRRVYNVAGYNSLTHHDGQHGAHIDITGYLLLLIAFPGLIRYKIVIHAFIDGFARFIMGIRANNNNRAATVFDLFLSLIQNHGLPSQVRGDHGGENVLVARYMEEQRGQHRGSYIWGR